MRNAGLFSTLFLGEIQKELVCNDDAQGRLVTLSQSWHRRDAKTTDALWSSFIKTALGNLGFVVSDQPRARGLYALYDDYGFQNCIALIYVVEPGANLDDESVGRFWPAKLIAALRERKLTWGILTDGAKWRLYSTKSAKPYEDHVELHLAQTLETNDETGYASFERFFHQSSFVPQERADYETEKVARFRAIGLKARVQRQQAAATDDENGEPVEENAADTSDRAAGIYLCRLDLDGELSEAILEARVKEPLLEQVDNVLRYICNGFIADTKRTGAAYTEEERRDVFESSVKLLYRCLFLFYAEARKLLPSEDRHAAIYAPHSIAALCREARKFRWNERNDTAGYDLWQQLKGLVQAVNEGDPSYGVMGYNGGLFDDEQEKFLGQHRLRNDFLWQALYGLAFVEPADNERADEYDIPYADLEIRHLGEMYEAILEYKVLLADASYLRRRTKKGVQTLLAAGQARQEGDILIKEGDIYFGETAHERKQSGSYYTPESLVRFLVGKAVIAPLRTRWESAYRERFDSYLKQTREGYDDAARRGAVRAAEELVTQFVRREVLTYKVCDLAMGSGHFLVAAANLMADFIVELLAGIEPLPGVPSGNTGSPNHWRRLITRHCLYGADLNPLAVNLAKLALWLNCFAREHKLTFLDHHLRRGNTLIGLRDFGALDDIPKRRKDTRHDKEEADHTQLRFDKKVFGSQFLVAAKAIASIPNLAEDDTDQQREAFEDASRELQRAFAPLADLYTAYLMDSTIRAADYGRLLNHFAAGKSEEELADEELVALWKRVCALRERHHFFHWPLEFPDVFGGETGQGFSATVGNPPWDVVKPNTLEFYVQFDPKFRTYGKQEALGVAKKLKEEPGFQQRWNDYENFFAEQSQYFTEPTAVPALGKGDINTYKLFLNRFFVMLRTEGRMAILVPSGLYTDEGCLPLRDLFFRESRIESLFCFENRWPDVFTAVDNRFKFITFSTEKGGETESFRCAFMQHDPTRLELIEKAAPRVTLDQVRRLSPTTLGLMEFNNQMDVDVIDHIYSDWPLLGDKLPNHWNVEFNRELDMTIDSELFRTTIDRTLPSGGRWLWEGKHIWHLDAALEQRAIYVDHDGAKTYLGKKGWTSECFRVGFRDVAASTNERTLIANVIPPGFHGNTLPTIYPAHRLAEQRFPNQGEAVFIAAILSSLVCDFVIRKKITNHMNFFYMKTLPIPRLGSGGAQDAAYFWPIVARALRLICTTEEYAALWAEVFPQLPKDSFTGPAANYGPAHEQALREKLLASAAKLTATWTPDCGLHERTPERRDQGDRAQTRAELDALVAHLYGLTRAEFAYLLDTFPVLRRKETAAFGEFQSKRKALEEYDRFNSSTPR